MIGSAFVNEGMTRHQKLTVSIVGVTLILLTLLGITYAYYLNNDNLVYTYWWTMTPRTINSSLDVSNFCAGVSKKLFILM